METDVDKKESKRARERKKQNHQPDNMKLNWTLWESKYDKRSSGTTRKQ